MLHRQIQWYLASLSKTLDLDRAANWVKRKSRNGVICLGRDLSCTAKFGGTKMHLLYVHGKDNRDARDWLDRACSQRSDVLDPVARHVSRRRYLCYAARDHVGERGKRIAVGCM